MYHKCIKKCITKIPVNPLAFLRKPDLSNSVCFVRPSEKKLSGAPQTLSIIWSARGRTVRHMDWLSLHMDWLSFDWSSNESVREERWEERRGAIGWMDKGKQQWLLVSLHGAEIWPARLFIVLLVYALSYYSMGFTIHIILFNDIFKSKN